MNEYIKKADAIRLLNNSYVHEDDRHNWRDHNNDCIDKLIAKFKELPPADVVKRKRGEWIEVRREIVAYPSKWRNEDEREPVKKVDIMCPNCGGIHSFVGKRWTDFDFCPLCGSDNRRGEEDEADRP